MVRCTCDQPIKTRGGEWSGRHERAFVRPCAVFQTGDGIGLQRGRSNAEVVRERHEVLIANRTETPTVPSSGVGQRQLVVAGVLPA